MPWRALGARKANTLPIAEQSSTPEWLLLRLGAREIPAVPVLRRQGALLLGISMGALTEDELTAGAIAGITDALGPTTLVQAEGTLDEGEIVEVDILLLDWPQALYRHLLSGGANWPVNAIWPHTADAVVKVLNYEQLAAAARARRIWCPRRPIRLAWTMA